ncbi:hypothetical protein F966_00315 [Acinetobacter higginsii]|uniref:Capsule polysaccharide biosynthesis protein n=1 Tax=Acinetobacter higginsii TaxID=70347 RepID=N8WF63_9GAMM|nr:hypothetical protein [Acinetobacter higginsii]ENV10551.1 hypothetical protein F966_00315 [Acinetobacter higginsii]
MPKIFRAFFNFFQFAIQYVRFSERRALIEYYLARYRFFWKKKKPSSEKYPFVIHDPFELFGDEIGGFEKLYLVGDNWVDNRDKPIIVVAGCTDWKFGFIADYLPEFRTAFGSRKFVGLRMIKALWRLSVKPEVVVIWGYTESFWLRMYLNLRNIPIWRMEDAFIRSASLGATHSTPYSLVIDKTGLYYNGKKPSDIENLLSHYDFNKDEKLKKDAQKILDYIINQDITKYNPPVVCHDNTLKIKKRILVVGQVDNDSSLRYGNPDKWTMEDMVRLAKRENPTAEILYRPHPEVYEGFQKSKLKKENIENYAKVISPDEHIIELINRVDHVYTLTSLTGLDALLRGKEVTVLGTPFYAGWGLTDDRCKFKRRHRKLSLLELFSAAYILYPDYLAGKKQDLKVDAILTTIYKIKGDVLELTYGNTISIKGDNLSYDQGYKLLCSLKNIENASNEDLKNILISFKKYDIEEYLLYVFFGLLPQSKRVDFLESIVGVVDYNIYLSFINDIKDEIDVNDRNQLIINFLANTADKIKKDEAELLFSETSVAIQSNFKFENEVENENEEDDQEHHSEIKEEVLEKLRSSITTLRQNELKTQIEYVDYEGALSTLKKILATKKQDYIGLLNQASNLLYDKFEFKKSKGLALLSMMLDINRNNRKALTKYIESEYILNDYKLNASSLEWIFLSIKTNPELISKYRSMLGREDNLFFLLSSGVYLDKEQSISKMMGYVEDGNYEKAHKLFMQLYDKPGVRHDKLVKVYTDFLHAEGKTKEAIGILNLYKKHNSSEFILRQLLRFYQFVGEFDNAEAIYQECSDRKFELNSTLYMPILLSKGEYKYGYGQYINENFTSKLKYLLGSKFRVAESDKDIQYEDKSIILAVYGPGDEIRFSSIYSDLVNNFGNKSYSISCDNRLYSLFKRSYPFVSFVPIARTRSMNATYPVEKYNQLPSVDLTTILDNDSFNQLEKFEKIFLVTDFISNVREDKKDFHGDSFLKVDKDLSLKFSKKLAPFKDKLLVGINWRSSLTNFSRMEHYLNVEEIGELFENDNITFVNLQYDDCQNELNWINEKYPGKIINFDDIDQFNDFESVSALMKNLDLVIAPATSVAELAGALGVKTWLFSNSSEIDWRKVDDNGTDIWHNSITIVDVPEKGNKKLLVEEINNRLLKFTKKVV